MKKNHLIIMTMLTVCGILGCSIQEIPEGGDTCPSDKSGEISYVQFSTSKCERADFATCLEENHKAAIDYGICPKDAPKCATSQDHQYFCTQDCSTHEEGWTSACDGQCIDPLTDERYCGASEICEGYTVCTKNQECIAGKCTDIDPPANEQSCPKDDIKCEDLQGMGLTYQCNGTSYVAIGICNGVSCHENDCGECLNDTVICENAESGKGQLKTCQNGVYQVVDCPNDMPCNQENECAECTFETSTCQNVNGIGQITSCINGKITTQACSNDLPCLDETQCAICDVNSSASCTDDKTLQQGILTQCNNGVEEQIICENSCKDNGCGHCINGTKRCINDDNGLGKTEICENGDWVASTTCSNASCNAEGTNCGACLNTTQASCQNNANNVGIISSCVNGEIVKQNCPGNAACNGNACSQNCVEGTVTCANTNGIGKEYTCSNNTLVPRDCPDNAMCNGNVCGECNADDNACTNDSVTAMGTFTQCNSGTLTSTSCRDQNSCNAEGMCGDCNNNQAASCQNNAKGFGVLTTCNEGKLTQEISPNKSCNADKTAFGDCKNGETQCTELGYKKTYKVCVDGAWQNQPCANSCTLDGKCGECTNAYAMTYGSYVGDTKCHNSTLYLCKNGVWPTKGTNCGDYGCFSEKSCAYCEEGSTMCRTTLGLNSTTAYLSSCKNGVMVPTGTCLSGSCNETNTACAE